MANTSARLMVPVRVGFICGMSNASTVRMANRSAIDTRLAFFPHSLPLLCAGVKLLVQLTYISDKLIGSCKPICFDFEPAVSVISYQRESAFRPFTSYNAQIRNHHAPPVFCRARMRCRYARLVAVLHALHLRYFPPWIRVFSEVNSWPLGQCVHSLRWLLSGNLFRPRRTASLMLSS